MHCDGDRMIRAAGGALRRLLASVAIEVALAPRPKLDDWSPPEGKLRHSEHPLATARDAQSLLPSPVAAGRVRKPRHRPDDNRRPGAPRWRQGSHRYPAARHVSPRECRSRCTRELARGKETRGKEKGGRDVGE